MSRVGKVSSCAHTHFEIDVAIISVFRRPRVEFDTLVL